MRHTNASGRDDTGRAVDQTDWIHSNRSMVIIDMTSSVSWLSKEREHYPLHKHGMMMDGKQ
jgi:hypothetical protein